MIIKIKAINDAEFAIELWKSVPSTEDYRVAKESPALQDGDEFRFL